MYAERGCTIIEQVQAQHLFNPTPCLPLCLNLSQILVQRRIRLGDPLKNLLNHILPVLLDVAFDLFELLVRGFIDRVLVGRCLALVLHDEIDIGYVDQSPGLLRELERTYLRFVCLVLLLLLNLVSLDLLGGLGSCVL